MAELPHHVSCLLWFSGVQAVMQEILTKHKGESSLSKSLAEESVSKGQSGDQTDNCGPKSLKMEESKISDENKSDSDPTSISPTVSVTSKPPPGSQEGSEDKTSSRPHSSVSLTSSVSSFQAYSSGSSAENSSNGSDVEENTTANRGKDNPSLMNPPKIVITDFSFDEPTNVAEMDPFKGVEPSTTVCISNFNL